MVDNLSISSSKMKRSIKYLLIFVLLFFVLDFITGLVMERIFPEITFGTYGKVNKSLCAEEEILIFGSSRAQHHYDPDIIINETGMSCYNTGLGGYGLFYNYTLLNEIIVNHKPKIVILDLSPNVIVDQGSFSKLNFFLPYYFDYLSFNEIIQLDPDFSKFKTIFKTYVYNSTFYYCIRTAFTDDKQGNGYRGLLPQLDTNTYKPMQLSSHEIFGNIKNIYLNKLINIAIQHNIRLICIVSPTFEKFDVHNRIIGEMERMIKEKGVEFYDYSDFDKLYKKPEYFKDQLHMNVHGVEIFNREVSNLRILEQPIQLN